MEKNIFVLTLVVVLGIFVGVFFHENDSEEIVQFKDNSVLVVSSTESMKPAKVGLPKVIVPSAMTEELLAVAERERLAEEKLCEETARIQGDYLLRPREIEVNITKFGGSWDRVVRSGETGSVGRNRLRSLDDTEDLYIAWPMPSVSDKSSKSPLDLPSVEHHFGAQFSSLSKRIEAANKALRNYFVEIAYRNEDGTVKTVLARVEDRGPRIATRFDASRAVWRALGLEKVLKGSPNSKDNRVKLILRLVPKNETKEKEDPALSEEIQFSSSGGGKFRLPSWDEVPEATTLALNP